MGESKAHDLIQVLTDKSNFQKNTKDDRWGFDTDRSDSETAKYNHEMPYELTFKDLLSPSNNFTELAEERLKAGKPAYFLDIFGSGRFIADTKKASGVLGIRSKDIRSPSEQLARSNEWTVLEGNVYDLITQQDNSTLNRGISHFLNQHKRPAFDFIVCRPVGPFENYNTLGKKDSEYEFAPFRSRDFAEVYYKLLSEFYKHLSFDGGKLFTEFPTFNGSTEYGNSLSTFFSKFGFDFKVATAPTYWKDGRTEQVLRVTKTMMSPKFLPPFSLLKVK